MSKATRSTCTVCGGPREDWSQQYTCKSCHRARVRESARRRKEATGLSKTPQTTCSRCHEPRTGRHPAYCVECWKVKREERWREPCAKCGSERNVSERRSPNYCNACSREYWLVKKYGLTSAQFDALLAGQDHRCAICGNVDNGRQWHVDHCHDSGAVRGILCDLCNRGLGSFKDDPKLLILAANYLESRGVIDVQH